MTLDIISVTHDHYAEWDAFCDSSDEAWFFHTSSWLEFALNYSLESSARSFSFCVVDPHQLLAVCPLLLESVPAPDGGSVKEFSFNQAVSMIGPAPALANGLTPRRRHEALSAAMANVDSCALELGVSRTTFRISSLAPGYTNSTSPYYNFLTRYEYLDVSLATQLISLDMDESRLWRDIRKGHRYDISRGSKVLKVTTFDQHTISDEDFAAYQVMHHRDAGRLTRPVITFEMQHRWIREGRAALFGAYARGEWQGFAYLLLYKDRAYWLSGCENPEANIGVPIGHMLQWHIIQWLKQNHFSWYEIGWQSFGPQLHNVPSHKDITISAYKRWFGGQTVPLFSGEKFYSREYYLQVFEHRVREFSLLLPQTGAEEESPRLRPV